MTLDYFYGQAGELFSFYRIPKALFQEQRFQNLSTDAKTLYGILLDRMSLSVKNGWLDERNRVFIIFTIEDVKRALCCADNKATKLLRELEKFGLIERKRRGQGKPSLVYVKNFSAESSKESVKNRDNDDSCGFKIACQDPAKSRCNKTKENDTEMSETDPFYSEESEGMSKRTHHDAAFLPEPNQPRLSDTEVMKISKKATTIAIVNQKGGTGKTTTCENLGIGLAMEGKKVLLVDADPQGSLTISMGWQQPDELPTTLSTLMQKAINDQSIPPGEGVLHHAEGVDLIPANIELAGLEVSLVNCMNREKMLKQVLEGAKHEYDFILLDCTPSLGMLTVNALAAADTTLIPVQAQYLSAKGLEQLLQTVQKVRRQINPKLKIEGILLTMTDSRTNYGQQIDNLIRGAYGSKIKVFDQTIPRSVRAAEISAVGKSIFQHDPKGKVAEAYQSLTKTNY